MTFSYPVPVCSLQILQFFDTKRLQVIQLFITDTMPHRFDVAPVDAHEKYVEYGGDHMKMFSQREKAQKIEKGDIMNIIGYQMYLLQCSHSSISQQYLE